MKGWQRIQGVRNVGGGASGFWLTPADMERLSAVVAARVKAGQITREQALAIVDAAAAGDPNEYARVLRDVYAPQETVPVRIARALAKAVLGSSMVGVTLAQAGTKVFASELDVLAKAQKETLNDMAAAMLSYVRKATPWWVWAGIAGLVLWKTGALRAIGVHALRSRTSSHSLQY